MNLEHNQTIDLGEGFFGGCEIDLVPIDKLETYTENRPMDVTVESGYFQDASGLQCKNCSSHSIEYLKKYGLRNLSNLNTESNPANSASVLTGHLNTYLASMQANYAGALGIAYINIFYAPYLVGMTDDQMYQVAQELIFNGSQNAFSRGGQSLHPSELIWVKENGKYKSVEIGSFADALIDSHPEETLENENYEVFKTEDLGFSTISFTRDGGKVQDMPIKYVARMPHKGKMYRIHTSNGIVNVTGDHSLFEFKGAGEIVPTKVKGMKKGDFIVVPHKIEMKDYKDSANLLDYLDTASLSVSDGESVVNAAREKYNGKGAVAKMEKECGVSREILRKRSEQGKIAVDKAKKFVDVEKHEISLKGDSQARIKAVLPLTKELGYVAGMYCSEGHNQHKKVIISNMDDSLLRKVTAALDSIGYPWYRKTDPKTYGEACGCVEINGVLGYFIQKSCSENGVKIVPDWAVDANDDCVKGFLEGFYDGEGNGRKKSDGSVLWSVSNTSRKIIAGVSLLQLRFGMETHVYESQAKKSSWNTAWELRESQQRKVNPFSSFTTQEGFDKYRDHVNEKIRQDVEWLKKSDLSVSIIKKIEEYDYEGYVYDISVPETEAFLGGIGSVFFKNTLFLDFNIHTGVPSYLKKIPAVGKGGKYYFLKDGLSLDDKTNWTALEERTENGDWCLYLKNECVLREHEGKQEFTGAGCGRVLTYGDFEEQARKFTVQLLNVWKAGDSKGRVFEFPKCDFHVSNETFEDPKQYEVYMKACELASANGSTYFIFDRDEVTLSACCRLRTTIEDNHMLTHPESLRFSFPRNELLTVRQDGKIRSLTFGRLFDEAEAEIKEEDGFEIKYLEGFEVWDENGWTKLERVLRHKKKDEGSKNFSFIRLNNGSAVCVTNNHPVIKRDTNIPAACPKCGGGDLAPFGYSGYGKRIVKCLSCGKYSVCDPFEPVGDRKIVDASEITDRDSLVLCPDITVERDLSIGQEKAYALGAYVGDGCPNGDSGLCLCKPEDHPALVRAREWLEKKNGKGLTYSVDRLLFKPSLLPEAGEVGRHAYMKQLPENFLRWKEETFGDVLSGVVDTDGCVHRNLVEICSVSKALLTQIQQYLSSLGIRSIIRLANLFLKQTYRNPFDGKMYDSHPAFKLEIGFSARLKELLRLSYKVKEMEYEDRVSKKPLDGLVVDVHEIHDNKEEYVYDITTSSHTFVVNGILLHNCGFQNITINIPQCAYRARKKNPADEWSEFFREIDATMDIAVKAHLQKKAVIAELMKGPGRPLWQIGKPANDGVPYVDLEKCTYIIGLIGVNDAVHFLYGKEFHQDEHALDLGLKIVSHMYLRAKHYTQQYGLKFTLEESPAESAARKLAKNDLVYFREEARDIVKGGDEDYAYYTNSVHISADAPVCLVDRIEKQAMFHSIIESGAITHAFVGEERPPKETIAELMKEVFYRTQSAQVTISPEFTYCNACGCKANGIHEKCPQCGSDNVVGETRVVGYFSKIQNWNKSKRYGELVARQKGRYSVMEAGE